MQIVPNAFHISQFYGNHHGTCTQTAAAVCIAAATGNPNSANGVIQLMLTLANEMQHAGTFTDASGSTIYNIAREVEQHGATILVEQDYNGTHEELDLNQLNSLLRQHAGVNPILLQIAQAHNLYDNQNVKEDANVNYHAIAIVGISEQGYIVADGNNPTVTNTFDTYPWQAIANAVPCALLILRGPVAPAPAITIPTGPTYTVQSGDTLGGIAQNHGVSLDALYNANHVEIGPNPNVIFPGQVLVIPVATPVPAARETYTVQAGDTLGGIAQSHNVALDALYTTNEQVIGPNENLIIPGQVLVIPR